ncbi:MAG: hypothetical protein K8T91_20510 [Planctomycetes bacterium]|nr:hypothetical protein [Planctomycetota bacterium]
MPLRTHAVTLLWVAVLFASVAPLAADDPAKSVNELAAGKVLPASWEYSTDGGKTFGPQPAKISGTRSPIKRDDAARVKFTIDDPAQVGLLKVAMASGRGAFALTSGASVDRYNVGACPTMLETKITLNGKPTELGLLPNTLYAYLGVDPTQLKKGENTLELSGTLWHKNYEKGEVPAEIRLEVLPANFVLLDRPPILGMVAPTYFGISARALIPSTFSVSVTPIEPPGPAAEHSFPRSQQLITEVPLPAGTKRFSYSVTVKAGGSAKTYGPYEAKLPKTGNGFRFMVAGGTLNRDSGRGVAPLLYAIDKTYHPDLFIHTGNYQNCTHWDFIWTDGFWRETQPTFAQTPMFAMSSPVEMGSPQSFTQTFFFPPDNKDWGHWTAVNGNVRFVAIEAFNESLDKSDGGVKWLEGVLKDAKEDYVILLNSHVTHGSATNYHRVWKQGMDHTAAKIDPLMVKYKVTLAIGSTHRCYERLEPPANVSVPTIISGRAGGMGWHIRTDGKPPNTASRKLSPDDHYCVFEVTPEGLKLNVWNFQGQEIDSYVFKPRSK